MNYHFKLIRELSNSIRLNITHLYHLHLGSEWNCRERTDDYNRLYYILGGEAQLFCGSETITMKPNHIYLIPSKLPFGYRCDNYLEKIFVHFTLHILPQHDLLSSLNKIITIESTPQEMEQLKKILYTESVPSALFFQANIFQLISRHINIDQQTLSYETAIYRKYQGLYQYIADNLYADTSVQQLCDYLHVSHRHLSYRFKKDTGITLKGYLNSQLIHALKLLLQNTDLSIKEIAEKLHFNDEFYCSRFFKAHTGLSPSAYRRQNQLSIPLLLYTKPIT